MTTFFNAFHAPIGAHCSFTLGCTGKKGGLGLELGGPADQNVYIGLENKKGNGYDALPFFAGAEDEVSRYVEVDQSTVSIVRPFAQKSISRDFRLGIDTWAAGDLSFSIFSPVESIPDPDKGKVSELKRILRPSVLAELTIDNTKSKKARRAFFGYCPSGTSDANRVVKVNKQVFGVAGGQTTGIFTDSDEMIPATHFSVERLLTEEWPVNYNFGLGSTGMLLADVPAGEKKTYRFAVCFYRPGMATTGIETTYLYNRYFSSMDDVAKYSLKNYDAIRQAAEDSDELLAADHLSADQRFQMIHAIRSYYGSTQLLETIKDGKPIWVVNEGEYRMMNTFDLTVDQLFFELKLNPWAVRNELDLFTSRYSYSDKVHFPGGKNEHPGGLSFTHDMGQRNHFSRPGYSSYEVTGLHGCFSYMTHEQLVNWILCAGLYVKQTGDSQWLNANLGIFKKCLTSLLNRDNSKASERNGIMGLDSSRTEDGTEITTYDSLDASLGQARNNLYMAIKGWASYLALEDIFTEKGLTKMAGIAKEQAERAAATIVSFQTKGGTIPAVMGEECDSVIIPAIEGLVFPYLMGYEAALDKKGTYGKLIKALHKHFKVILKRGVCLYPTGAWKLSSTADNSWLSKIYLCQFVARQILGERSAKTGKTADAAHVKWLLDERNVYFAWSDQIKGGIAKGSKYYPRGVTNILWLDESE